MDDNGKEKKNYDRLKRTGRKKPRLRIPSGFCGFLIGLFTIAVIGLLVFLFLGER